MKSKKRGKKSVKKRSFKKVGRKIANKIAKDPDTKKFVKEEKSVFKRTINRLLMRLRIK